MADTFTSLLRLVLQETGGNQNVWGGINNASLVQLVEAAIAGRIAVDVTGGDVVLTTANGATDQARNAMLAITGNPGIARNVTVPSTSKLYMVSNETSPIFDVTIKTAAGSGVIVPGDQLVMIYVDPLADETFIIGSLATETQAGIAPIATQAQVDAGSDDTRIVTPFKLANATSLLQATETQKGALEIADQAETDAGSDDVRAITPAKLAGYSGEVGSFTATLTGMDAPTTGLINFIINAGRVTMFVEAFIIGTSNTVGMGMTGIPVALQNSLQGAIPCVIEDNSLLKIGFFVQAAAGTGTFFVPNASGILATNTFTAANLKGLITGWSITYPLAA